MAPDSNAMPAWRRSIETSIAGASQPNTVKFVQLASVDARLGAQVRTVVFRGFDPSSTYQYQRLWVASDANSAKISQFSEDDRTQLVWYFPDTREQFRLSGQVTVVDAESPEQRARHTLWAWLSPSARESFFTTAMGLALDNAAHMAAQEAPPANFVTLSLLVNGAEHLHIASQPHRRTRYFWQENTWLDEAIAL